MSTPTPSDGAIKTLLAGGPLACGSVEVGPLSPEAQRLLRALVTSAQELANKKGAEQAAAALKAYRAASDSAPTQTSTPATTTPTAAPPRWRLHRLRGCSIRGLAPHGEEFSFAFNGESTFIYGPNGTGKSSLMNALGWTLTGEVTTDCEDGSEEVALTTRPKGDKKPKKIRDWPVIATLPARLDPEVIEPACWAELTFRSSDGTRTLYLHRTLQKLETSEDGTNWRTCTSLEEHGISPLDLQLSITAATMFGRQSLESAPNTRSLLSLMLGFDALEELGGLCTSLARNLTAEIKKEKTRAEQCQATLDARLTALAEPLRDGHQLRKRLAALTGGTTSAAVAAATEFASAALREAEAELGSKLGIGSEASGVSAALESALTTLSRPLTDLLPTLTSVQLDNDMLTTTAGESLDAALAGFERTAAARIQNRRTWWRQEVAPGSKARLLIQAASAYDPAHGNCPLCEQSLQGSEVAGQLGELKDAPPELRAELRVFFRDLADELDRIIPEQIRDLGEKPPAQRLQEDWQRLLKSLPKSLTPLAGPTDITLGGIIAAVGTVEAGTADLMPRDAEAGFRAEATSFLETLQAARLGVAVLNWATENLATVLQAVTLALLAPAASSLSGSLARGKDAAGDLATVTRVRDGLVAARSEAVAAENAVATLKTLQTMREAIDEIKGIGKYAEAQVALVFDGIREKTRAHFGNLYPHSNRSIPLSRLHLNTGRDMTVEPLFNCETFEVPGQHFSNAGCLRAIALAFYFALLDNHPGGLGFVIMDDPILSLDDNHRESWSANVLRPALRDTQVILATHQRQFLNNCRTDFTPGRIVELNPRASASGRLTLRPGDRLDRAEQLLESEPTSAATELRKYCEDLLITLDAYSPVTFLNRNKPAESLDNYAALTAPHPLAGPNQTRISQKLRGARVLPMLNAGSHAATEADVSEHMVASCLEELRALDLVFRRELERLEDLRLREIRGKVLGLTTPAEVKEAAPGKEAGRSAAKLKIGDDASSWTKGKRIPVIGTAAAQTRGCVIDLADLPSEGRFAAGTAVLVEVDSLAPLARPGQWALLAAESEEVENGDYAAIVDTQGNRYLRRVWHADEDLVLVTINPTTNRPAVVVRKCLCKARKLLGVMYSPVQAPKPPGKLASEWTPRTDFPTDLFKGRSAIRVQGSSLEPLAGDGQVVVVGQKVSGRDAIQDGMLAAVETDAEVGHVLKRVYPGRAGWALLSPNPIDPRTPLLVPEANILGVLPVHGVLFNLEMPEAGA